MFNAGPRSKKKDEEHRVSARRAIPFKELLQLNRLNSNDTHLLTTRSNYF